MSGCYERRYGKHGARPEDDDLLERAMATMPYLSTRMSELSADMAINSLGDGCHTVSAWWQDKHALRSAHLPTEWG